MNRTLALAAATAGDGSRLGAAALAFVAGLLAVGVAVNTKRAAND